MISLKMGVKFVTSLDEVETLPQKWYVMTCGNAKWVLFQLLTHTSGKQFIQVPHAGILRGHLTRASYAGILRGHLTT